MMALGRAPPSDGRVLSWCGTAHHHPSRMKLVRLAKEQPQRLACVDVIDTSVDRSQHRTLAEQVRRVVRAHRRTSIT